MMKRTMILVKKEYASFWTLKKIICMLFAFIFYYEDLSLKMGTLAQEYGYKLNTFEPFVLIMSYENNAIIVPLVFVVLLAGFPERSSGDYFNISRLSRRQWLIGEAVYAFFVGITFVVLLLLSTILPMLKYTSLSAEWSDYTRLFFANHEEAYYHNNQLFIRASTVTQGNVVYVLVVSIVLMVLYLMLMTQLMLMFSLLNKKLVGYIVTIFITLTGVISIDYIHNMKWKLPVAHAIFGTHFRDFYYKPEMSLNTSFAYFILLIAIVMVINCFLVKKYKFGDMNNDSDQ